MRRFVVSELSMSPALAPGDRMLARRARRLRRGQVVFFPHPHHDDFWLVKRVIGLPGETVRITGGTVQVDGGVISEPWAGGATLPEGEWQVPPGHMFVLSDARHRTRADSRTLGPVPTRGAYVSLLRYGRSDSRPSSGR